MNVLFIVRLMHSKKNQKFEWILCLDSMKQTLIFSPCLCVQYFLYVYRWHNETIYSKNFWSIRPHFDVDYIWIFLLHLCLGEINLYWSWKFYLFHQFWSNPIDNRLIRELDPLAEHCLKGIERYQKGEERKEKFDKKKF